MRSRQAIASVGAAAIVLAVGCHRTEHGWSLKPRDAGPAPAYQLAEVKLDSHGAARWWTLPDGAVPGPSEYYPCTDCHDETMPPDPTVRELTDDHETWKLQHGDGRIWCLSCHDTDNRDMLVDRAGRALPADHPEQMCAGCHSMQFRDWVHGAHGKRVGRYRGERKLLSCISCHDPHAPAIQPRKPSPAPRPARRGGGRP